MTGRRDEQEDQPAPSSLRAGRDSSGHEGFWGPERSGLARGVLLVIVGIVICVVLLPSGTRAPLSIAASTTPSTTVPPASHSSSTTTSPGGSSATTTTTPVAATVHVLVANGTSANGVAGVVTTYLGSKGFPTLTATNALTRLTASVIYFTAQGSAAEATEVASALTLSPRQISPAGTTPPVASVAGAAVVVIVGQDLATRFAPAPTTTTTRG